MKFKLKNSTSPAFKLDTTDLQKLGRDALIVGGAAAVGYMVTHISDVNMGEYTALLIPIIATVLNLAYKWFKDNSPE